MELPEIKKFLDSGSGIALKRYLNYKLEELGNIDSIKEKDVATHQALEVKAQKRAYVKLKEILQDVMTFSEDLKTKDPRDNYDVGVDD